MTRSLRFQDLLLSIQPAGSQATFLRQLLFLDAGLPVSEGALGILLNFLDVGLQRVARSDDVVGMCGMPRLRYDVIVPLQTISIGGGRGWEFRRKRLVGIRERRRARKGNEGRDGQRDLRKVRMRSCVD